MKEDILVKFKEQAQYIKNITSECYDVLLIKSENLYGFCCIDSDSEELDSHCEECLYEFLPFSFRGCDSFPYDAIYVGAGRNKLKLIQENKINLYGIEILGSLLK